MIQCTADVQQVAAHTHTHTQNAPAVGPDELATAGHGAVDKLADIDHAVRPLVAPAAVHHAAVKRPLCFECWVEGMGGWEE